MFASMKLTLLMAQTLDGKIARNSDHFPDWTSKEDKKLFVEYTKKSGVMIFGYKTFKTLPGKLPGRLHVVLSQKANTWEEPEENIVYTSLPPAEVLKKLEALGFENPILGGGATINGLFAREKLIDEVIVTVSPVIFGEGLGVFPSDVEMKLQLESAEKLGDNSLTLKYKVLKE